MIPSWIHFDKNKGDKNSTVQVTCDANTTINERTVQVVVTTDNKEKSNTLSITQKGLPDLYVIQFSLPASIDNHLPYVDKKAYLSKTQTTDKGNMVSFGKVGVITGKSLTIKLTRAEIMGVINVLSNGFLSDSAKLYLYSEKDGIINPEMLGAVVKQVSGFASEYLSSILNKYANLQVGIDVVPLINGDAVLLTGSIDLSIKSNLMDNPYRGDLILEAGVSERGTLKYYECARIYLNNNLSSPYKRTVDLDGNFFIPTKGTSPTMVAIRFRHSQLSVGNPRVCTVTISNSYSGTVSYASPLTPEKKVTFMSGTNAVGLAPLNGELPLTDAVSVKISKSQLIDNISITLM